jgi:ATP-dependent DNA ligase
VIAAQIPIADDPEPDSAEPPLRCVGRVGSGLSADMRTRLHELLHARRRDTPFLPCEEDGLWVEPGLYCVVSYLELTRVGHLRAPVFLDLIVDP